MKKRIIWDQMTVRQDQIADILTTRNMQPGKFLVTYIDNGLALIIFVEKEVPNVE